MFPRDADSIPDVRSDTPPAPPLTRPIFRQEAAGSLAISSAAQRAKRRPPTLIFRGCLLRCGPELAIHLKNVVLRSWGERAGVIRYGRFEWRTILLCTNRRTVRKMARLAP